jgi:hypothetical protein
MKKLFLAWYSVSLVLSVVGTVRLDQTEPLFTVTAEVTTSPQMVLFMKVASPLLPQTILMCLNPLVCFMAQSLQSLRGWLT